MALHLVVDKTKVLHVHRTLTGKVAAISRESHLGNAIKKHMRTNGTILGGITLLSNHYKERYYYANSEEFIRLLDIYNEEELEKQGHLHCVGHVNVAMRMCSVCGDSGKKKHTKDRYYVYKNEKKHTRNILCHGCVGYRLKMLNSLLSAAK